MSNSILVVLAHPDDETFGMGGTIAFYTARGVDVQLVCATKGEAGEVDGKYLIGGKSIGEVRAGELECAAKVLGISRIHWLGYRDSGMQGSADNGHADALVRQKPEDVAVRIRKLIERIQPEIVITFDPLGGYKHPDHIAVHNATKLAVEMIMKNVRLRPQKKAAYPRRLYFHTFTKNVFRVWVRIIKFFGGDPEHYGKNKDINFLEMAEAAFPIDVRINYRRVIDTRNTAFLCHASQGGGEMRKGLFSIWERVFGAYDHFTLLYPARMEPKDIKKDLFFDLR